MVYLLNMVIFQFVMLVITRPGFRTLGGNHGKSPKWRTKTEKLMRHCDQGEGRGFSSGDEMMVEHWEL